MIRRNTGVVCLAVLTLTGCVTTTSGPTFEGSDEEAAEYNMQLGIGYLRQGKLEPAREKLEKSIEQDPNVAEARTALALVYERLGDSKKAEKQYRAAVQLAPDDPDALNALGVHLCRKPGGEQEAMTYFNRATQIPIYPRKAMLYTNAGNCARSVDQATAERYFRAALEVDPRYREAMIQLSDFYHEQGSDLQARAFLERYLSSGKPSPEALWLGVRVEQNLGDQQAAVRYGDQLLEEFPVSREARLLIRSRERG